MRRDDIIQEVREIREAYAKQFGCDLAAICRDLKEKEKASGRKIVSFPPRRPKLVTEASSAGQVIEPVRHASGDVG